MRVLLLFPMQDLQTGPAIKYAFEKLGHEVGAVDAKLWPTTSYKLATLFKPDLVFCSRTYQLTEQIEQIKRKFKDTTICMWNVDTRDTLQAWEYLFPLVKLCDYHFVVDTHLLSEWKELNPSTFWLPQGLQNEVYHKPDRISKSDILKYECDVSFAGMRGGFHAWREPYLQAIEKMGVNFKYWQGIYGEDHNKMVACSKINLSISYVNEYAVSVRDYKIMGAGGFLLELYRDGLFKIFPMDTIATFKTLADISDLIDACLKASLTREKIAENGHDWVHKNSTYTHRISRALEIMRMK